MSDTVLVCVAHPDDEALGCGATMAWHAARGDAVHVLFLTNGVSSRTGDDAGARDAAQRREAALSACRDLGAREPHFRDLPDNAIDQVARLEVNKVVEAVAREVRPTLVYTHHPDDLNVDHRRAAEAVLVAFRPQPGQSVRRILACEVPSSTEWTFPSRAFRPTTFVDAAATLATKLAALRRYEAEMRPFPHSRSLEAVEALARWRGASVGLPAAEAFEVLREVIR